MMQYHPTDEESAIVEAIFEQQNRNDRRARRVRSWANFSATMIVLLPVLLPLLLIAVSKADVDLSISEVLAMGALTLILIARLMWWVAGKVLDA